jgi:hypothetical protein
VETTLVQIGLALVAVVVIALSPFGRETLGSIREGGLTLRHARQLVRTMTVVALLVVVAAALNVR